MTEQPPVTCSPVTLPRELRAFDGDVPGVDDELESLGHFAFEWRAGCGWWTSPGGRALLGLPAEPAFVDDDHWWSCAHPEDRASATARSQALRRGADRCDCNFRTLTAPGAAPRWVQVRARAVAHDADGLASRLRGTLTEIDAPAHEFLATRQHELRLVEAVDQAHIAWYEREGERIVGSATIAEMFDLDSAQGPWQLSEVFARLDPLEFERHRHDLRVACTAPDALTATHVTNYRIKHRDGSERDIEIRYRIVATDEPVRTYGLIFDVTETKALEAKFEDAMEHAGVAWFERDIATDVLHGSRSLWHLYGIAPEIQPLRFADLHARIHPDEWSSHPAHARLLSAASRDRHGTPGPGPAGTLRYRVKRSDDGWRWIEVRYVTQLDGHGGGSVSGLVFDVSAEQEALNVLHDSNARLLLALDATRMATWQWNVEQGLVHSSDVLADLYGMDEPGPWPAQRFFEIMHPEDRVHVEADAAMLLARPHDEMLCAEFRIPQADGSERWFEVRARSDGDGVIGVSTDITARKRAEVEQEQMRRQLQQAQKMEAIGQLTGGIAHDFNNILASVLGYADLALKRYGEDMPERLTTYVREIQAGGRRARDLVRQLLAFSREEGSELSPVALTDIVEQSIRMLRPTLPASMIIELRQVPGLPAILADTVQLQQVVMNLCINARDAMAGAGRIDLDLGRRQVTAARCASCQ